MYKKIFLILFVATMMFVIVPSISSASTISDLQAQITSLLAQVKQLQAQLAQMQGSGTAWCHTFNTNLGVGSSGDEIASLSNALVQSGLMEERGMTSVFTYDEVTASAVTGFQEKYKNEILTPQGLNHGTGYMGKATLKKLNALYGCGIKQPICPTYSTYAPNWCSAGTIVSGGTDTNGCPLPPKCIDKNTSAPVISGVSGPTALNVGQTGTWTVSVNNPNNSVLGYHVIWGDEYPQAVTNTSPISTQLLTQTATFTHTYNTAGNYKPTFYVTVSGASDVADFVSLSVNVINTTQSSIKVLSPNGGEQWAKGSTQTIQWQDLKTTTCQAGLTCSSPTYDIKLISYNSPCISGYACNMGGAPHNYTIARYVSGTSYSWTLGTVLDNPVTGAYTIQVCQAGTDVCDSSNAPFSIY